MSGVTYPCRHDPPCRDEAEHWDRCGEEYPDHDLNMPLCIEHGEPADTCACNFDSQGDYCPPLVRDEVVTKRKPGFVVVQVREEALKALRMLRQEWSEPMAGDLCRMLWDDLQERLS